MSEEPSHIDQSEINSLALLLLFFIVENLLIFFFKFSRIMLITLVKIFVEIL